MLNILNSYSDKPFSREIIKEQRKGKNDKKEKDKSKNSYKFNFSSEDKSIKINFNVKKENLKKDKMIEILEKLISDIKGNKIKEFDFK